MLAQAGIRVASPARGIGCELTYGQNPRRIVVVHFGEDEAQEYLLAVTHRILELDEEWLLLTRYGSVADLDVAVTEPDAAAIAFASTERLQLAEYLCTRSTQVGPPSADLYVLAGRGDVLVTWDHHTTEDGLSVELQSVSEASRLLISLNELGAEMDVLYSPG
jgi:hypothetical protein